MNRFKRFLRNLNKNKMWLLFVLPGTLWFLVFSYLPMAGIVVAFKDYKIHPDGFVASLRNSEWVGFENFEFLFTTSDAWIMTRNTLVYNAIFIIVGLIAAVTVAILLSEITNRRMAKGIQTGLLFPHFLSWVVVSFFAYTFLSPESGVLNRILVHFGADPVSWYNEPMYWPFIIVFAGLWKGVGYGSIVYLAAIAGIDKTYYEAAMIDGASKWQQIKNVTIPMLVPLMVVMTIMSIGRVFYSDFGLFYNLPMDSGPLYPVTQTIDTYVYRSMTEMGNISMSAAACLYQSFIGFILVLTSNFAVRKIDKDYALF